MTKRLAHVVVALAVLFTPTLTFLVLPATAAGALSCEKRVIADWLKDGSIDGVYALPCYEAAIEAMPNDLRDYSDATDAIQRSLAAAVIKPKSPGGGGGAEPSPTAAPAIDVAGASASFPLPVMLVAAVVLMLGAAAFVGRVWHRAGLRR